VNVKSHKIKTRFRRCPLGPAALPVHPLFTLAGDGVLRLQMKRELTSEQKAKALARKEKFRALVKQVAGMSDVERAHLTAKLGAILTCEGRALSMTNTMLLLLQIPGVSIVGGFRQWLKHGRAVRKGEHGASIWFPRMKGEANRTEPAADGEKAELHFLIGTVFDIGQTMEVEAGQGEDEPSLSEQTEAKAEYEAKLETEVV
jgi:hypothetical protein